MHYYHCYVWTFFFPIEIFKKKKKIESTYLFNKLSEQMYVIILKCIQVAIPKPIDIPMFQKDDINLYLLSWSQQQSIHPISIKALWSGFYPYYIFFCSLLAWLLCVLCGCMVSPLIGGPGFSGDPLRVFWW